MRPDFSSAMSIASAEVLLLLRLEAEAVPGGEAVCGDAPVAAGALERLEGRPQPPLEFRTRHLAELRFGIVQVVEIDALDRQVPAAALDLVIEESRRERVAAVDELFRLEHSG